MRVCPHARLFGACGCVSGREGPETNEQTNDACVPAPPGVFLPVSAVAMAVARSCGCVVGFGWLLGSSV